MLFDSLQSRRFLMETLRNIDHGRHLKKQKTNSPLKSVFDSPQLSGSFNVQDDWIALLPKKKNYGSRCKIRLLCCFYMTSRRPYWCTKKNSCVNWTVFSSKNFHLIEEICIAADHVSESALLCGGLCFISVLRYFICWSHHLKRQETTTQLPWALNDPYI